MAACEKFAIKNPSITAYDERFFYYSKNIEELQAMNKYKDFDFIKLSIRSICDSISHHAKEWIKCYGNLLNETSKRSLFELKNKLNVG
jgi:hypothetical protein